jgi:hypothetical protein
MKAHERSVDGSSKQHCNYNEIQFLSVTAQQIIMMRCIIINFMLQWDKNTFINLLAL